MNLLVHFNVLAMDSIEFLKMYVSFRSQAMTIPAVVLGKRFLTAIRVWELLYYRSSSNYSIRSNHNSSLWMPGNLLLVMCTQLQPLGNFDVQ